MQNRLSKSYLEDRCMGTFTPEQVGCPMLQAEGRVHFSLSLQNLMASSQSWQRETNKQTQMMCRKSCLEDYVSRIWWSLRSVFVLPQWPK